MERINQYEFYRFGKEVSAVAKHQGETPASQAFLDILHATNTLRSLLNGVPIPLGLSRGPAEELWRQLDNLMAQHFRTTNEKGEEVLRFPGTNDPPIDSWSLDWYRTLLEQFETIFREEMRETATYFVPRRGIFSTVALVDSADESFPAEIRMHLPQKTCEDWKAAGRCLAFNLLSASGFHVARAVEGTLETYYQLFSGRADETLHSWHDYIEVLKKIGANPPNPAPDTKTLAELDQMRKDYRNPIVHPRVVLTEPDARMLFANGESLIIAMGQEIAAIKAQGGVQLSLPAAASVQMGRQEEG